MTSPIAAAASLQLWVSALAQHPLLLAQQLHSNAAAPKERATPLAPPAVQAASNPGVRNAHAMAYDESRRVVVMFGGADARSVRADTWIWNGATWSVASAAGPSGRTFPAMAFDAERDQVVLFGGRRVLFGADTARNTFLADTWVWNGFRWREVPVTGPPARAEAAVAYDSKRGRVVLFGGYNDTGGQRRRLGDTWEWDGSAWRQVDSTGPSPRNGAVMAFDRSRGKVVLFGGSGGPNSETWEWEGQTWARVDSGSVPGRYNAVAAYDESRGHVIRFGGWDGQQRVGGTWASVQEKLPLWRLLPTSGPSPRNHSAMVYDRARNRIVLFGGHDGETIFGDTWEWDGTAWLRRATQSPEKRVDNRH